MRKLRTGGRGAGFLLVTLGAVLWGTGGIAGSIVATHSQMSWLSTSALRLLAGGLIMIVVTAATGELRRIPRTGESARHIAVTAVLVAIAGASYFQALAYVGVAVATVLSLGTSPLFVAVVTAVRGRRVPSRSVVVALLLAVVGLVLVSDISAITGGTDARQTVLGVALGLVSGVAFGGTTIVNRRVVPGLSPAPLIATSFTVAGLISLAPGAAAGFSFASMTSVAWLGLAYLAVVQTVLGYLFFYVGLQRGVPATSAAILTLLEPLTATVLAMAVLHEPLSGAGVSGIVLLLTAVVLVRPPRTTRAASTDPSVNAAPRPDPATGTRPIDPTAGDPPPGGGNPTSTVVMSCRNG